MVGYIIGWRWWLRPAAWLKMKFLMGIMLYRPSVTGTCIAAFTTNKYFVTFVSKLLVRLHCPDISVKPFDCDHCVKDFATSLHFQRIVRQIQVDAKL